MIKNIILIMLLIIFSCEQSKSGINEENYSHTQETTKRNEVEKGGNLMNWHQIKESFQAKWDKFTEEDLVNVKKDIEEEIEDSKLQIKQKKDNLKEKTHQAKEDTKNAQKKLKFHAEKVIEKLMAYYNYSREEAINVWEDFKKSFK